MLPNIDLIEAKQYMTDKEKALRKKLIRLLLDDGKGHHHKKYAQRLADFIIKIIPVKMDPNFTAGISFEHGTIYISEGFLVDESLFFQLNVLMRHELAHNLLMHEIRMLGYLGEAFPNLWNDSVSLHGIMNSLMDFEISNEKYTDEDKVVVEQMFLNGRTISGLITEKHRADWIDLPLERMVDKIEKEINDIHGQIALGLQAALGRTPDAPDHLTREISSAINVYRDTTSRSYINMPLDDLAKQGFKVGGKSMQPKFLKIIKSIYEKFKQEPLTQPRGLAQLESTIQEIANSHPTKVFVLLHPETGEVLAELHTPEQKEFAIEVLKKYRTEEDEWYHAVMGVMMRNGFNDAKVEEIWTRTRGGND